MDRTYENDLVKLSIKEGILYGTYKVKNVDLAVASEITRLRNDFTAGGKYPVLVDYTMVNKTTKEARGFFTDQDASQDLTAMAILINSPVGRMLSSFFIAIYQTTYPVKIFTDKGKAVTWLKEYLKKNQKA